MSERLTPDQRLAAQETALLMPETMTIGRLTVRAVSGGDVLLGRKLGLVLTSGDPEKIVAMTPEEQSLELVTIGALLCHPESRIAAALWQGADAVRAELVGPLLFRITSRETAELIEAVTRQLGLAASVAHEIEPKPADAPPGPEPAGN